VEDSEIKKEIHNIELRLKGKRRIIQALKDEIAGYEEELVKAQNEFNTLESELFRLNSTLKKELYNE
jgi:predicted  nucleic acid-binding Zn-ribbon protein